MKKKTLGAAEFKKKCLALLNEVGPEGIVVTQHGKPVAKLIPIQAVSKVLIGSLKDKIRIQGDILSTGIPRDAES